VNSKEIEFVGRITKMKDRMYIEIPKDYRKAFGEFSKDSLIVKVRKVLG
jgi:bifunctional DNA-binding transcriptional regulator/antitoxin component of YhaV-PrlF toxin-antitoxin module